MEESPHLGPSRSREKRGNAFIKTHILKFIYLFKSQSYRELFHSPKWLQVLELGRSKAGSQGLPPGCRAGQYMGHPLPLSKTINRELDGKWNN